jgi:ribose transport system substrate-binding protein
MKKLVSLLLVVALSLAVTVSLAASAEKKFVVAMVPPALVSPYFIEAADAAKKAAAKYGNLEFTVLAPSDETKVDEQIRILEDLIQKKVNLILISSGNWEAVAPVLKKAISGGIDVAIFNQLSDVPVLENIGLVSAVGVDEVAGGKVAGEWVAKVLNGKGNVAILEGVSGDYWTVREGKGIDSVLSKHNGIKVVARQPANWERAKGLEVTENILQANKQLDVICAMNDNMALGAAQGVENAGRKKQIKISGYNGNEEALKAIAAGKMDATVNKQPSNVGRTLIEAIAMKIMKGEKKDIKPVMRITPVIITAQNVNEFLKK